MGQTALALIDYSLSLEEVINLPSCLGNSSDESISGNWEWTKSNMSRKDLIDSWNKNAEYFLSNPRSEEDLAMLKNGNLALHFLSSTLVTFDCLLNSSAYYNDEISRNNFNGLTKTISSLLKATDVLIVPDLSNADFFDEDLNVDAYRQKANGNKMFAWEL